ncbi:MAG TPA: OmpH family outer membrane protein [Williamwhitmania sp.]|nr:OmpH family outer membrane protein [Williamwhitmania sp.]
MKNFSLISNIVLAAAVVVLFILHFTPKASTSASTSSKDTTGNFSPKAGAVVFVDVDSLISKYDMYIDLRADLEKKGREKEAQFNAKAQAFQKEAADFQDKVQKGLVTRSQAEEMQQALQQKQQGIYQLQDQLRGEIADEQQVMNNKTLNSIMEYLKEYNKDKGYSYVVSRSFGGPVLFADPGLNITADVLRGLNEKYASTKKDSAK